MKIRTNGKEITIESVVSTSMRQDNKTYPALRFIFAKGVTEAEMNALCSGTLEILDDEGNVIGIHEGYTTRNEHSFTVGKITTAEQELNEAKEVIEIISGDSEITAEQAQEQRGVIEVAVQSLADNDALTVKTYYPTWEECVTKGSIEYDKAGYKFTYNGDLYSCVNANPTFQTDWIPGKGTESLYTRIDETHSGTADDPIPYSGNMALENGKYYEQDGIVYICTRDTVNPVYNALSELIGLYVEVYTE